MKDYRQFASLLLVPLCAAVGVIASTAVIPNLQPVQDPTGYVATYNTGGNIDKSNPFFQSLGTNGRTCETCHQADQAFSMSAQKIRQRFVLSQGKDPLFAMAHILDWGIGHRTTASLGRRSQVGFRVVFGL